jgi:hypothetical protein
LKKTWWKFQAVYLGIDFLGLTLKAQAVKAKLDKWDCIKIKSFCTSKETLLELRDNTQNGRKPLQAIH